MRSAGAEDCPGRQGHFYRKKWRSAFNPNGLAVDWLFKNIVIRFNAAKFRRILACLPNHSKRHIAVPIAGKNIAGANFRIGLAAGIDRGLQKNTGKIPRFMLSQEFIRLAVP